MKVSSSVFKNMRGILVHKFGGIDQLKVTNEIVLPTLTESQVCVEIHSSGVNPVDTYVRSGNHPSKPKHLPYVPGKDGAGIVTSVGSHVTSVKAGDRVFVSDSTSGTLAETIATDESRVHSLPHHMSFDQGAALGIPYCTAYRALFQRGFAKAGHRVLIHGASGAVGTAALQIARAKGIDYVVGTAGTKEGKDLIMSLGAKAAYCHRDSNYVEELKKDHGGFDVIIEMLANVNLQNDLQMINRNATVVIVGSRGDVSLTPRFLMGPEAAVVGCSLGSATKEESQEAFEFILSSMESGGINPVIGKTFRLDQIGEAHEYVINQSGSHGKVIVRVRE